MAKGDVSVTAKTVEPAKTLLQVTELDEHFVTTHEPELLMRTRGVIYGIDLDIEMNEIEDELKTCVSSNVLCFANFGTTGAFKSDRLQTIASAAQSHLWLILSPDDLTSMVKAEENKQQFLSQPHTKLLSSTMDGDLCGVKLILLEAQAVINTRGLNRRTPVMLAAGRADKDMFDLLVREGADLSLLDKDRRTILHIACEGGNICIVNYILTKDIIDIDSRDNLLQSTAMKAALTGNKDVFELLVRKGTDLSFVDSKLNTILHLACSGGSIEIVNHVFTEKHVDVNSRNADDCTPILNAATKGHKDVFDLLVNKGANMALRDFADNTVLHAACEGGNVEIVQYILRQNVTPINAKSTGGFTAVLVAANNGHGEVFDLLVAKGADLLILTEAGDNILHEACRGGSMKLVTYVLNQNIVDINSRGNSGMTPSMKAASTGHKDIFDLLQEKKADLSLLDSNENNILHKACKGGNVELVRYVLTKNIVDINSKNKFGTTSAMEAAVGGHKEVLHLLMSTGADLTLFDEEGLDILHIAFSSRDRETVKFILTYSIVNINDEDEKGMTPALLSAEMGYRDVFDLVVSRGADLASEDYEGNNIIQKACVGGNLDIVKYVLTVNTIVRSINETGKFGTPVMFAASLGYKDVFDLLVKKGADLTQRRRDRDTILHLACRVNIQIVRYLVSRNIVDINVRGNEGRTPAIVAAGLGNIRIFEELVKKGADPTVTDLYENTILHHATLGNRVEMVKYILSRAIVDITLKTKHGSTAALIAKKSGFTAVYNVFLSHASLYRMQ
ncbi:putative ankyrin repeat protein RF_0381 [Haliotis cracherodii]|uniref:putative ankyrin repeat protein RF_0381 n=1 Tax=Haliotis cracherodii TaxID=6455 RepID=UPI0039E9D447